MSKTRQILLFVAVLTLLAGCTELAPPQSLHPPAWIYGEWSDEFGAASYTFSETTVIQRTLNLTMDLGEMYLATDTPVTETVTSTLYSFSVPTETETMTMEFTKVNATTISLTMIVDFVTIGPTLLYLQ